MKNYTYLSLISLLMLVFSGCEPEEKASEQPFVIGFESQWIDYGQISGEKEIGFVFSETPQASGFIRIRMTATDAVYGSDFTIGPVLEADEFVLPFSAGQRELSFVFRNLQFPAQSLDKTVVFQIVGIDYPFENNIQGYTSCEISFKPSIGATKIPNVGGPNQGNQVYFDLSTERATEVRRDSWDLGFYSGDAFRVCLNGSIYMAAKKLDATNIDVVNQAAVQGFMAQVGIGTFDPANADFIDDPSGNISGTAIDEIASDESQNHVYLLNLGYAVGTEIPAPGAVAVAGNARGWKKIRILREGENYKLQYADLNSSTHQEISIGKNQEYNFSFFSFSTNSQVSVEPEKDKWDLNFTVFTNIIDGAGSYGYSDFVLNNIKAGVKLYQLTAANPDAYADFSLSDVDESAFVNDQRIIGADWRDVFSGTVYANKFYVIRDADGLHYKIRMLGFLSNGGERGYPKFEYTLLQ